MTDEEKGAMVDRGMREIKMALAGEPFRDAPSWKDYEIGFRAMMTFLIVGPSPESELVETEEEPETETLPDNVVQLAPPAPAEQPAEDGAIPPAPLPPAEDNLAPPPEVIEPVDTPKAE